MKRLTCYRPARTFASLGLPGPAAYPRRGPTDIRPVGEQYEQRNDTQPEHVRLWVTHEEGDRRSDRDGDEAADGQLSDQQQDNDR